MLEDFNFSGQTDVVSCPQSAVHLQMVMVLASLIPGLMNTGWWATWLVHKQLKKTNLRHPSESWMHPHEINKEIFPCMFYNPTPCRTPKYLEQSIGGLNPPEMNLNSFPSELNSPGTLCESPFISPDHDIMVMMSWASAITFKWETSAACAVDSCWPACTDAGIPNLPFMSLHGQIDSISQFSQLWHIYTGHRCTHVKFQVCIINISEVMDINEPKTEETILSFRGIASIISVHM